MAEQAVDDEADDEPVLAAVLDAERDADDMIDDPEQTGGDVAEKEACGSLDDFDPDDLAPDIDDDPGADTGMIMVGKLDGVPLFFARGVPERPQSFPMSPAFRTVLEATVKSVRFRAPQGFGRLESITSAGAFVDKPGAHGKGRAFDHDAWTFANVDIRPLRQDHAAASRAQRQRYWALAAIIRSRSAFVLHGEYDAAHRDHIHQDEIAGTRAFTTGSEASVKLVQALCKHIYANRELKIDGDFGNTTKAATRAAMRKVDLPGDIFDNGQWERFLLRSGRLGFELSLK